MQVLAVEFWMNGEGHVQVLAVELNSNVDGHEHEFDVELNAKGRVHSYACRVREGQKMSTKRTMHKG